MKLKDIYKQTILKEVTSQLSVQQISKRLIKAGLKKSGYKRVDFKTIPVGDYDIRHIKMYGINKIVVQPVNGYDINKIMKILKDENPKIVNGYVVIER
jgi:hypothetical protein